MKVGIIAEGPADVAVLVNILKGRLGLDRKDVLAIRPDLASDETDLHEMAESRFSNWGIVKQECVDRARIAAFVVPFEDDRLVVIHIDTAEADLPGYDVKKPGRQEANYAVDLRQSVVEKINEWLAGEHLALIRHAVAVEEMDAWLLPLWSSHKDTAGRPHPKEDLEKAMNKGNKLSEKERKRLFRMSPYERYAELSSPLRKRKGLDECASRNESLRLFVESL
jgi:Ni/Co efflux regulator RcnB